MILVVSALACVAPAGDESRPGDSGPPGGADTAPTTESPRVPAPSYTAEEAAVAMTMALRHGLPTPVAPIRTWLDFMALGDDGCPGASRALGGMEVVHVLGCVSESGCWFQGVGAAWSAWLEPPTDGYARSYSMVFSADGTIADPQHRAFEFGGTIELLADFDAFDRGTLRAEIQGSYAYPGADAAWLAEGASLAQYWTASLEADGTYALAIEGGFSIGTEAVDAQGLTLGGECGDQLSGTLGLRDPHGHWYDLTFDTATCDGCGDLVFAYSVEMGRACVDVAAALSVPFDEVIEPMVGGE